MVSIRDLVPAGTERWTFARIGGVDQVVFRTGADLARLPDLDLKLWMALAMPTTGLEFDPLTAKMLDTDQDGRIRPPELIAAVRWAQASFHDLGELMTGGSSVPLSSIRDPVLLAAAKGMLADSGKSGATAITLDDVMAYSQGLAKRRFNGDGVIAPDTAGDNAAARRAIEDILRVTDQAVEDRSGKPGLNKALLDAFQAQAETLLKWAAAAPSDSEHAPLGLEKTQAAWAAVHAVKAKVDDYFVRSRLAAFDAAAGAALTPTEQDYRAWAARSLSPAAPELLGLPLAKPLAGQPLPLEGSVNPAWSGRLADLSAQAVAPLLGPGHTVLAETDWLALQAKLAPYEALVGSKPQTRVEILGLARLRELTAAPARAALDELIRQDLGPAPFYAQLAAVEKLVRFQRDLYKLITNFVNFADFYGRTWSVFQAGTLYVDARACDLCLEVGDTARHAALAGLSGAYLAYCDVTRPGGLKKTLVAVVTDGDSDNLMVGRNGVFYDRQGRDWDATVTRVVANPISVREAFWLPYKKLVRFIEEQVAKRAQTAEQGTVGKLSATAETLVSADKAKAEAAPKKLDLGTIALIGTAVGGVSALVGGFLQALFGLGFWLPLGVAGLLLLISGPSMILAWLKLRQRNLAPILDANGWAMNTRSRVNVPFGASLTALARLPPGSVRLLNDPFAEKKRPWKTWLAIAIVVGLAGYGWRQGWLDRYLPERIRSATVLRTPAPAAVPPPAPAAVEPATK